mgnify:CR=1 FL=1
MYGIYHLLLIYRNSKFYLDFFLFWFLENLILLQKLFQNPFIVFPQGYIKFALSMEILAIRTSIKTDFESLHSF